MWSCETILHSKPSSNPVSKVAVYFFFFTFNLKSGLEDLCRRKIEHFWKIERKKKTPQNQRVGQECHEKIKIDGCRGWHFFQADLQWCPKIYTRRCGFWVRKRSVIKIPLYEIFESHFQPSRILSPQSLPYNETSNHLLCATEQSRHIKRMWKPVWKPNTGQFDHLNK